MPTFNTGNDIWDQGVGSLAGALFPDPSRAAQGYLYGSQARREQLLGNKIIDEQNARSRFNIMSQQQDPGPLVYTQPQQTGAAPILAPPPGIQMQGQPLSNAMMPSWRQGYVPQTMSPQQVASQAPTYAEPFTKGKPPPVSRPSAVSPPAPNGTTSIGTPPENDYGSGPMQPASISTENGGPKQASPANTDGSPMPATFNLAHYVAMAVNSGMDAAQASLQGQAMVGEMYRRGQISKGQWMEQLASVGAPTPFTNAQTVAGQIASQQIASGATIKAAEIGAAERRHATDVGAETQRGAGVFLADPNDPNKGQWVRADQIAGRPGFNPATAPTVAQPPSAVGQYLDKTKPGEPPRPYTHAEAMKNPNLVQVETQPNAVLAGLTQQLALAQRNNNPEEVARLQAQVNAINNAGKAPDAQEQYKQAIADRDVDQRAFPPPQKGWLQRGVKDPVALGPEAETIVQNVARQLKSRDAAKYVNNPALLRANALEYAKVNGLIQNVEEVNKNREAWKGLLAQLGATGDKRAVMVPGLDPKNPAKLTPHLAVQATKKGLDSGLATPALAPTMTTPMPTNPAPTPGPTVNTPPGPTTAGPPAVPAPQPEPPPVQPSPVVQPTAPAPGPPAPQPQATAAPAPTAPVGPPPTNVSSFLGSLFGAQPSAAAAPAQAAPTVAQTPPDQRPNAARILSLLTPNRAAAPVSAGMPIGALGPAPAGARPGDVVVSPSTGRAGLVDPSGRWVMPQTNAGP